MRFAFEAVKDPPGGGSFFIRPPNLTKIEQPKDVGRPGTEARYGLIGAMLCVCAFFLLVEGCNRQPTDSSSETRIGTTTLTKEQFRNWLREQRSSIKWSKPSERANLDPAVLHRSLQLGRQFLLSNQKRAGNFNYTYNFVTHKIEPGDDGVRQAGALWGLSLLHLYQPGTDTRTALERGINFFLTHSQSSVPDQKTIAVSYLDERESRTGAVALSALALIEFLRSAEAFPLSTDYQKKVKESLDGYLQHLQFMRLTNGHFADTWSFSAKARTQRFNPYSDGEGLLCFVKAAKYLGYTNLVPVIKDSAWRMAADYTAAQWTTERDSDLTKGFFQWSCMAFAELRDVAWGEAVLADDYLLLMGWWMVHVHDVLGRTRNTAYAFEGLIPSYGAAMRAGDTTAQQELRTVISEGLARLTAWQVGGPLNDNKFLAAHPTSDPRAVGGVMNSKSDETLRIDVTQHQMHAVLMALEEMSRRTADLHQGLADDLQTRQ